MGVIRCYSSSVLLISKTKNKVTTMLDDSWVIVDQEISLDNNSSETQNSCIKINVIEEEIMEKWTGQRWRKYSEDSFTTDSETKEESEESFKNQEWTGEMWRKYI